MSRFDEKYRRLIEEALSLPPKEAVERLLPLADAIASKTYFSLENRPSFVTLEDAVSIARAELVRLFLTGKVVKNSPEELYAYLGVRLSGAVIDACRRELSRPASVPFDEIDYKLSSSVQSPEEKVIEKDTWEKITELLSNGVLSEDQKEVIRLRLQGVPSVEIARRKGVSPSWISQLYLSAVRTLRRKLRADLETA